VRARTDLHISILIDTTSSTKFIEEYLPLVQKAAMKYKITPVYRPHSGDGQVANMYNKLKDWGYEPGKDFAFIIGDSVDFAQAKSNDDRLKSFYDIDPLILTWGIGAGFYKGFGITTSTAPTYMI
jgi:hypothetical protein